MATESLRYLVTADTKGFVTPMRAVGALVTAVFVKAVQVTAEFEKELSKLRAVSGATATEMGNLETNARNLGKSTAFTATEVASLQVELAKLGFTTNDILNASGGVLDLAAGLGVDLADAAVLTGSTLRAFGLSTEETGRVVDVLAKSASSSALDFSKLTESLKQAAPIARAANISFEDTVALLGTLANAGIHGSNAGTALKKIFIELNASGLSLNDAYKLINNSSNKLATASELVGKRAGGALLTLANGASGTQELADSLNNAEGAAQKMRETMEDNLIGDFEKLKSAINEVFISIGQDLDPIMRGFVQTMTKIVNSGILLDIWDNIKILVLDVAVGVLEVGRTIDRLSYIISKGPFGTGTGDSSILLRIINATEALEKFRKKRDEIRKNDNSVGIDFGDPLKTTPSGGGGDGNGGGGGSTKDYTTAFGLMAFSESGYFDAGLENITGFLTKVESKFTESSGVIKEKSKELTDDITVGWELAGAAMLSAIGQAIGSGEGFDDLGNTSIERQLAGYLSLLVRQLY